MADAPPASGALNPSATTTTAAAASSSHSGDSLPSQQLLEAAAAGDVVRVTRLLNAQGADPGAEGEGGVTPLMAAAEAGCCDCVTALLEAGAPWHAQDSEGYTAGEYASGGGHQGVVELLLDWAVKCELLLGTADGGLAAAARRGGMGGADSAAYLRQKLEFQGDKVLDERGEAVMMAWEAPLMARHAEVVCPKEGCGDILNVGFGLGIVDTDIQARRPRSHTIIEAHPDVYAHMVAQGWDRKPGVRLVFGRWQDVVSDLGPFDGIFWDTYAEYYEDMAEFHAYLPRLLKPEGVYSFFNGLAPDNIFYHLVYGRLVALQLKQLGIGTHYTPVPINATSAETWQGVANRYWHLPMYFLPTCTFLKPAERNELESGGESTGT